MRNRSGLAPTAGLAGHVHVPVVYAVASRNVAVEVRYADVGSRVHAALAERNDVVDRGTLGIGVERHPIDRPLADSADPAVALADLVPSERLGGMLGRALLDRSALLPLRLAVLVPRGGLLSTVGARDSVVVVLPVLLATALLIVEDWSEGLAAAFECTASLVQRCVPDDPRVRCCRNGWCTTSRSRACR